MSEYFDPSPRASKRRKSNTSKPTELDSQPLSKNATLSSVSSTITNISRRLFSGRRKNQGNVVEDSGYGSKEDDFNAENVLPGTDVDNSHEQELEAEMTSTTTHEPQNASQELENEIIVENEVPATNGENEGSDTGQRIRSSGRERRRPRRFSVEKSPAQKIKSMSNKKASSRSIASSDVASPKVVLGQTSSRHLKGILTPSKRKQANPKTVLFDESTEKIEADLGFRDIETSSKKRKKKADRSEASLPERTNENESQGKDQSPVQTSVADSTAELSPDPIDLDYAIFTDVEEPAQPVELPEQINLVAVDTTTSEVDSSFLAIKAQVLSQTLHGFSVPIVHLESQYESLHALLSSTITAGESNSLLLLGGRGSGKSLLLNTALDDLTSKYRDDFHVIRLNGFFQTDDKLAAREIWRQLGREMQVSEDETGEVHSYADTMASLLSLLSHPDEIADPNTMSLDEEGKAAKSIIFILDEFDLFTTHPRQTLLYNLFDIAQSRKAPIAVIGCSTRMDVTNNLEKRVKSRFSHRWLHVPSMKSLLSFEEATKSNLCLKETGLDALGLTKQELALRARWNEYIKTTFLPSPSVQALIKQVFYSTKSLPDLLSALYIPIATATIPDQPPASEDAASKNNTNITIPEIPILSPPSMLDLIPTLPTLHVSLLVAASRLDTIHHLAAMNFNLVYSHYVELVTRSRIQRSASGAIATGAGLKLWSKDACRAAWEELGDWEVIVPVSGNTGGGKVDSDAAGNGGEASGVSRMWRVDTSLDEIAWAVKEKLGSAAGAGEVLGRWCREI